MPSAPTRPPWRAPPSRRDPFGHDRCSSGQAPGQSEVYRYKLPFVIAASSAGTVIEWYDFYLYGVLAVFFATQFFPPGNDVAALLSSLAAFGAGFAVRPFGAAVFGRIGDIIGRKFTFLLTITLMGGCHGARRRTADICADRPPRAIHPRHASPRPGPRPRRRIWRRGDLRRRARPDHQRGKYTSWIQTTATVGLLLALAVILFFRLTLRRRRLQGIRLADPVHPVGLPRRARACDPAPAPGDAAVLTAQGRRPIDHLAVARELRRSEEPAADPARAVRDDRRSGGRLVSGPVPGVVLHAEHPRREVQQRLLHRGHGDRARDTVLHRVRAAVRSDRAQADHPRRLPDRGAHLLPDLQPDVHGGEPGPEPEDAIRQSRRPTSARTRTSRC